MQWVIFCAGLLVGGGAIIVAQCLLQVMHEPSVGQRLPYWWYVLGAVTGGITGWSIDLSLQVVPSSLLVLVMLVFLVQAPIDFTTHRLVRPVTYLCTALTLLAVLVDVMFAASSQGAAARAAVSAFMVMLAVGGAYGALHRISPRSLGWGDVLLVVPLSLALGYVHLGSVAVWQLIASLTGAAQALAIRRNSATSTVAFGPHLLFAAWLVLLVSV